MVKWELLVHHWWPAQLYIPSASSFHTISTHGCPWHKLPQCSGWCATAKTLVGRLWRAYMKKGNKKELRLTHFTLESHLYLKAWKHVFHCTEDPVQSKHRPQGRYVLNPLWLEQLLLSAWIKSCPFIPLVKFQWKIEFKKTQVNKKTRKKKSLVSFHFTLVHLILKCTHSKNLEGPTAAHRCKKKKMEWRAKCNVEEMSSNIPSILKVKICYLFSCDCAQPRIEPHQ